MDALDKRDVTDVARAQGWVLPQGWAVTAELHPDDHYDDPRDAGDCYAIDFAVPDYNHPDKGFCQHCDQIITKIGAERARKLDLSGVDADTWADSEGSVHCPNAALIDCPDCDTGEDHDGKRCTRCDGDCAELPGPHELADPVAVTAWRNNDWSFYGVIIEVRDTAGRVWGQGSPLEHRGRPVSPRARRRPDRAQAPRPPWRPRAPIPIRPRS
ncbi:MAG: hypothetical protein ACREQ5_19965 [Candidatus Dormibacteria bacterium]